MVVTKLDPTGTTILLSTHIGGVSNDGTLTGMGVDNAGNIFPVWIRDKPLFIWRG